jgi:hypothetical protein
MATSMKNVRMFFCLLFLLSACYGADKKPAITQENLTKLRAIRTIFVDGNSESADKLRQHLESQSCFTLVTNKSKADAIMSVSEENKPGGGPNWLVTSIVVTTQNGDQIWSKSKGGGGFVHSGAGMATDNLLHDLKKDACGKIDDSSTPAALSDQSSKRDGVVKLFNESFQKQGAVGYAEISGDQLIVHSEHASSMRFHTVLANQQIVGMLTDAGIAIFLYTNDADQHFTYDVKARKILDQPTTGK